MAKDGFDLNKACPAILLNTELAIYKGFLSKTLLEFGTHWRTVRIRCGRPCTGTSCLILSSLNMCMHVFQI